MKLHKLVFTDKEYQILKELFNNQLVAGDYCYIDIGKEDLESMRLCFMDEEPEMGEDESS